MDRNKIVLIIVLEEICVHGRIISHTRDSNTNMRNYKIWLFTVSLTPKIACVSEEQ